MPAGPSGIAPTENPPVVVPATGHDDGTDPAVEFTARWLRRAVADAAAGVRMPAGGRVECVFGYTPDGNQHLEETLVVDATAHDLESLLREDGLAADAIESVLPQAHGALTRRYPHSHADAASLWPAVVGRRAGGAGAALSTSFGFGGHNVCLAFTA